MASSVVFRDEPRTAKGGRHKIITSPDRVVRMPVHPFLLALQSLLQNKVEYMLQLEAIEESHSPRCSALVMVPKLDVSIHVCIDFRQLNTVSTFDAYSMPQIEAILY